MSEFNDLVPVEQSVVRLSVDPEQFAQRAIAIHQAVRTVAVRLTRPNDWVKMGSEPYMTVRAVETMCKWLGISTKIISVNREDTIDESGKVITYRCVARAWGKHPFTGEAVEAERTGIADSKDDFFAKRGGTILPASEVDLPSIEKKAETNAMNRACKAVLGFHPTWEELQAAWGGSKKGAETMAAVEYKTAKAAPTGKLTVQKAEIGRMVLEMAGNDKAMAADMLLAYTSYDKKDGTHVDGVRSVGEARFSDKWAETTEHKVKREYEDFQAEQALGPKDTEEAPPPTEEA